MGTNTAIRHKRAPRSVWFGILRGLTAGFGICAIAWAAFSLIVDRARAPFEGAADSILRGESFDSKRLGQLRKILDTAPTDLLGPAAVDDVAVIRLRLLEVKSNEGTIQAGSPDLANFRAALVAALSENPNNSFLWLADYWTSRVTGDASDRGINALRMSYETGPNEAWIANRRNRIALKNFHSLPPDLAEQALSEFVRLVQSRLYRDAANILAGPGWPIHQQLLNRLAPLDETDRFAMARELARKDLDGVSVPGIPNDRPSRPF